MISNIYTNKNLKIKAEYIVNNSEYQGLITEYVIEKEYLGLKIFIQSFLKSQMDY